MTLRPTQNRWLSRVLALLLAVSFVLGSFHTHDSAMGMAASVVTELADASPDHDEKSPEATQDACPICIILKQAQGALPVANALEASLSSVYSPRHEQRPPQASVESLLRPPIRKPA